MKNKQPKIFSVNVQIVSHKDNIILVRGATEILIEGKDATEITVDILQKCKDGSTYEELLSFFPKNLQTEIKKLLDDLLIKGILFYENRDNKNFKVTNEESDFDIFGWQFGLSEKEIKKKVDNIDLHILGVNNISIHLINSLSNAGFENIKLIDYFPLNNQKLIPSLSQTYTEQTIEFERWLDEFDKTKQNCLVPTCDFGGQPVIRYWNEFSVKDNLHYFPLILDKSIGYIGPFVIPNESSCYECMWVRENSNQEDPELFRYLESSLLNKSFITGFHPSMPRQIADIATTELSKFYLNISSSMVNRISIYKFLIPDLKTQNILKIPRCRVCSPLVKSPSVNTDLSLLLDPERNLRNMLSHS